MAKAINLQAKAAEYGFDWPTIEPVFEKLQEEIGELKQELILIVFNLLTLLTLEYKL